MKKILISLFIALGLVGIGWMYSNFDAKSNDHTVFISSLENDVQEIQDRLRVLDGQVSSFGAISIPDAPYLFQTSLVSRIEAADTSMTLNEGTLKDGTTLTGYQCFTIDTGKPEAEYVCGTASGTAVSNLLRGTTPLNPAATSTSLAFVHRRGADVRITDGSILQVVKRLLNGQDAFPNALKYDTSLSTSTIGSVLQNVASVEYVNSVAVAGAPDASSSQKGLAEEATTSEINAGTASGGSARLYINPFALSTSIYFTQLPSAGQKLALAATSTPSGSNLFITQQDWQKANAVFAVNTATTTASNLFILTLTPALPAYATGTTLTFISATTTTGSASATVNSLGNKAIKRNGDQNLEQDDIKINQPVTLVYDGTNFQLNSPKSSGVRRKVINTTRAEASGSGTQTISGVGFKPRLIMISAIGANPAGTEVPSTSEGSYDGTTQGYLSNTYDNSNPPQAEPVVASDGIVRISKPAAGTTNQWVGVASNIGNDGFDITWTMTGNPGTVSMNIICIE